MSTRRGVLTALGAAALAGCSSNAAPPAEQSDAASTAINQSNSTETDADQGNELTLSGREWYFNWIHGEDEQILSEVQGEESYESISFSAIDNALETGMASGGRNQAVANALETASQEYQPSEDYEDRHTHMLSAIHQVLEQKDGDEWDFEIDSRLDATPSQEGWMKYSRVDVETEDEFTDNGNKKYHTIRAALTEKRNHTTHIKGQNASPNNTTKRLLQQISNPESSFRSLFDKDALDNEIQEWEWDEKRTYDQVGMNAGILIGGGIEIDDYEDNVIGPEYVLFAEDGRENEILNIIDEYEEQGDMTLRNRMREEYFNNGYNKNEVTEYNITADGSVSMEELEDTSVSEQIADA
jgi:hypothetical protein